MFSIPPPGKSDQNPHREEALAAGKNGFADDKSVHQVVTSGVTSVDHILGAMEQRAGGYTGFVASAAEERWSTQLNFSLNGKTVTIENPDPRQRLSAYLRHTKGLTGTKVG